MCIISGFCLSLSPYIVGNWQQNCAIFSSLLQLSRINLGWPTSDFLQLHLSPQLCTQYRTSASASSLRLDVPHTHSLTVGDWAFAAANPTLWNSLPHDINDCVSLTSFYWKLKTCVFCIISMTTFVLLFSGPWGFYLDHFKNYLCMYLCMCVHRSGVNVHPMQNSPSNPHWAPGIQAWPSYVDLFLPRQQTKDHTKTGVTHLKFFSDDRAKPVSAIYQYKLQIASSVTRCGGGLQLFHEAEDAALNLLKCLNCYYCFLLVSL